MKRISKITLSGHKKDKQKARESLASGYRVADRIAENEDLLSLLAETPLEQLDRKIKHGENLTFEEAFCGMCYPLAATNNHFFAAYRHIFSRAWRARISDLKIQAQGTAFVQAMAYKEAIRGLTPDEVAGIAAAILMDTVIRLELSEVIDTCGMGADIGFVRQGVVQKTINTSTLSAIVLASLGLPVIKHGSYANTSAVGSTEAIELFGARITHKTEKEIMRIWRQCKFCYLDAHLCKTIHDLSHLLMMETINHVVGPMTPPISRSTKVNRLMGVNEKVHPSVIAKAYAILQRKGRQTVGNIVVVCGLDEKGIKVDPRCFLEVKRHTILDEVSPYASVVAATRGDDFLGTFLVKPSDFGVTIDPSLIPLDNTRESIQRANQQALQGENPAQVDFLAMNAALGLFAERYLSRPDAVRRKRLNHEYLQECFQTCQEAITSGEAQQTLERYVKASGGTPAFL